MKIGVSGHRYREGADWPWVRETITDVFLDNPRSTGWSSLAAGADQIFAEVALSYGNGHTAVLPGGAQYRETFSERDLLKFDALLATSRSRRRLRGKADGALFRKAGELVVRSVELMIFVWDGDPAAGEGGTADIVAYARTKKRPLIWLDPIRHTVAIE